MPRAFLHPRFWPIWAALAVLWGLAQLPQRLRLVLGAGLGDFLHLLSPRARRTARRNLALCFPTLDERARRALVRRHFRLAAAAALGVGLVWWAPLARLKRLMRFRGREHYDTALAQGRSIILLAPHFIGMEAGGVFLAHEREMVSMYKHPKNALWDEYLQRGRRRFGGTLIERSAHLRGLVRLLRAGKPFYYLPDQSPGDADHVFAPFFEVPTATLTSLARLARLADAVVIPCFTRLLPGGAGYEIVFHPALADFPSDDNVRDATAMNAAIEAGVREMPEQYMWTYKRFKHRPDGELSLYD
jgi:lipid A biosynthesis lauroyl/palmitoleoyl acyltransferase